MNAPERLPLARSPALDHPPAQSLVVLPAPFRQARIDLVIQAGMTLAEMMEAAPIAATYHPYVRIWVDDWEVPRHLWATARPKAGHTVYLQVVAQGGGDDGKNPLATILGIALMLAAPGIGAFLAGDLAGAEAFSILGTSVTWGQVIGVGVGIVGQMAISALFPPSMPSKAAYSEPGQTPPSYQITGARNEFRRYANIPRLIGKRRMYPLMAAVPFSESQGNDQYVRLLLLVGYGPLKISDIKIGETPIEAFAGVEVEITEGGPEGWAGNAPITLYTQAVREDSLSVELKPDTWQTRTSHTETDEIIIDVAFPRGLVHFADDGSMNNTTVVVEVQYKAVGGSAWLTPTWLNTSDSGMGTNGVITATDSSQSAVRRAARWKVAATGQYEVRVRRTTPAQTVRDVDNAYWSALRSITHEFPVSEPQVCLIALRIKASAQLNGTPDTINCIAESYLPVHDGSSWSWQISRSPAWGAVDMLRRRGADLLMTDDRIDLAAYRAYAGRCEATAPNAAEPYWLYDGVFDGGSIFTAISDMLSHGRAGYTVIDGKHSVVEDLTQTVPVQHITPRNSWSYSGSKKFTDLPHCLKIKFTNADKGYVEDEIPVYADGFDENTATRFESHEYYGCTRATQAWRIGRYLLAYAALRPEEHSVYLDIEALRCSRGALVRFAHDVILVGLGTGRIKGVTVTSGNVMGISLDAPVAMAVGVSYAIRVRKADGTSLVLAVDTLYDLQADLTLTNPVPEAFGPQVGDLFLFGEAGRESMPCLVKKIEPGPGFTARLSLIPAAPEVLAADSGPIPPFNSYITSGIDPRDQAPAAPVFSLRSDGTALARLSDGTLQDRIGVSFQPPPASAVAVGGYDCQFRATGAGNDWSALVSVQANGETAFLAPVLQGSLYDVRARAVSRYGIPGPWAEIIGHEVIGKSSPPGTVPWASYGAQVLRWGAVADLDVAGYRWRWQPGTSRSWADATPLHDGLVQSPWTLINRPAGPSSLLVKAVDVLGNESDDPAVIVLDLGDPLVANIIYTRDFHALGFPGTISQGTVESGTGDLLSNSAGGALMWSADSAPMWTGDSTAMWPSGTYQALTYTDSFFPADTDVGAQLTASATVSAESWLLEFRRDGAGAFWGDDADAMWTADGDSMWDAIEDWRPWPGTQIAEPVRYEFRLSAAGGYQQARVSAFALSLDVPDIIEKVSGAALLAGGSRLSLSRSYRGISNVQLTLQADGGSAITVRVMDKLNTGPLIQGFDVGGSGAACHVDATIQGF